MSYPLGSFDVSAPLLDDALNSTKEFASKLPTIPKGLLNRVYLHWAVEPFGCTDASYNCEVDFQGGKWVMVLTHDPRDNAPGLNDNSPASHTWHRNTGAIGIAISGMDGATENNFGPDGVQVHQLEHLCALAALCCATYGIDSTGVVSNGTTHTDNNGNSVNTHGENNILTHAECAVYDKYTSERWDLGTLVPLPQGVALTDAMRFKSGDALRHRIHLYAAKLKQN